MLKSIDLRWGDDLRVDPLLPDLAMVGATYHEVRIDNDGKRLEESAFLHLPHAIRPASQAGRAQ